MKLLKHKLSYPRLFNKKMKHHREHKETTKEYI